jgi:uncharacterized damage-inducible protein DinB
MSISDTILPEFDQEMANTRKTLERVPEDKFDWKPHEKSMAMGGLATHLTNIPTWTTYTLNLRTAVAAAADERWAGPWSLLHGGNKLMTLPRTVVMRNFVMNHMIHHRAQLGVYLRLNDVAVPSIYGPSADESPF